MFTAACRTEARRRNVDGRLGHVAYGFPIATSWICSALSRAGRCGLAPELGLTLALFLLHLLDLVADRGNELTPVGKL